MAVDPDMKCPGCGELIPRWFTYHGCGWRKPGVQIPTEAQIKTVKDAPKKFVEGVKEIPDKVKRARLTAEKGKTVDEFTKEVDTEPTIDDVFNTLKSLVTYMARIEEMTKAMIEQQGIIQQKLNQLIAVKQ